MIYCPSVFPKGFPLVVFLVSGIVVSVCARELSKEDEELVRKMIASSYSNEVRYLSREEARTSMEQAEREMKETAKIMEPYVRYFETNTPVACAQLLRLIPEARILASVRKLDQINAGCPSNCSWSRFQNHRRNNPYAKDRCALVEIQILWCLYRAIPLAEQMDLDRAAEIFIEEKSYDDWSGREKDEKKRRELQHREARQAAKRYLENELVYSLKRSYRRLEDDLVYRLDRDRREKRMEDFNRFAEEIRRVVKEPRLAERLIRADIDTPHHASERRFKRIEEIFRKRDEEGIAKIEAEEKRWLEERMRQQRERNREIMEEERQRAKRRGGGK